MRKPQPEIPTQVISRIILKQDKKTGSKFWLCCNDTWLDQIPLLPEEDLVIPTRAFEVGTTVEISGKLTKEILDKMSEIKDGQS